MQQNSWRCRIRQLQERNFHHMHQGKTSRSVSNPAIGALTAYNSVMVSAFTVLCFMIDGRTVDLNLSGGEVTLEVCHIVHCIPETELYIRKYGKMFCLLYCGWSVVSLLISQVLPIGTKSVSSAARSFLLPSKME